MKKVMFLVALLFISTGLGHAWAQDPAPSPGTVDPGQTTPPPDNVCKGGTCGIRRIDGSWDKFDCPTSGNLVCPQGTVCRCVCSVTISGTVNTTNVCANPNTIPQTEQPDPTLGAAYSQPSLRLASFLKTLAVSSR